MLGEHTLRRVEVSYRLHVSSCQALQSSLEPATRRVGYQQQSRFCTVQRVCEKYHPARASVSMIRSLFVGCVSLIPECTWASIYGNLVGLWRRSGGVWPLRRRISALPECHIRAEGHMTQPSLLLMREGRSFRT